MAWSGFHPGLRDLGVLQVHGVERLADEAARLCLSRDWRWSLHFFPKKAERPGEALRYCCSRQVACIAARNLAGV